MTSAEPVDSMAQAIHEHWRREAIAKGETAPTWEELDEPRRRSSRDQARHIPTHVQQIGCSIAPLDRSAATDFRFTDGEITQLSIAEHERWNRDRIADGWTLAATKDVARKQTPYLLGWEELREQYPDIADLDAVFIRAMPAILAAAGLRIVRAPG